MNGEDFLDMIKEGHVRLHSMVCEQLELLAHDRFAEFLALSKRIQDLQQHLSSLTKRLMAGSVQQQGSPRIGAVKAQISDLQAAIDELYAKMAQLISEKKDGLSKELAKLKKGQRAIRGYRSKDKTSPRFVHKTT